MERIIIILVVASCLVHVMPDTFVSAYEIVYDANDPADLGNVPVIHDGNGIPSTSTRWKSARLQATSTGTATHFIIRIGSNNIGTHPVGYAVYASTGPNYDDPPADTPLVRGFVDDYSFGNSGYYAFPFNNDNTLAVTQGTWYHLVFLLAPELETLQSTWRIGDPPSPAKWGSRCSKADCDPNQPPGVGSEDSFASSNVLY